VVPDDGRIYVWDLSTRQCTHTFVDEGCLRSTALAASPDGVHIATGYTARRPMRPACFPLGE
jgi:WD40 repeat protein